MKTKGFPMLVALALLLPLSTSEAAERDCLDREPERVAQFGYERALDGIKECLGADNDKSSKLAQAVAKLPKGEANTVARAKTIFAVLGQLKGTADVWASSATDPTERAIWLTISEAIARETAMLEQPYDSFGSEELRRWKALIFSPGAWQVANDRSGLLPAIDLMTFDLTRCAANPPVFDKCETYASRKDLLRVLNAGYLLGQYAVNDEFIANLKRSELRDTQWTQYHEEALFQWPWEHVLNGYRMKNSKSKLCDRREDGMQVGFCRVPNDQLIFLHPDTALQWVSGAENSSEMHGAAYIELFGRYSWRWNAEGRISRPKGWSVIALYTNLSGESELGYGLMYHGKRAQTIAVTVTDGHVGILASLALADRFFTASSTARSKLANTLEQLQAQIP